MTLAIQSKPGEKKYLKREANLSYRVALHLNALIPTKNLSMILRVEVPT